MKSFIIAALTVFSLGIGVANAASANYNQTYDQSKAEALGGQGG